MARMGDRRIKISDIWTLRGLGEQWDDPQWVKNAMMQAGFENVTVAPHSGENILRPDVFVQEMIAGGMLGFAAALAGWNTLPPEKQETNVAELTRQLALVAQEHAKGGKLIHRMQNLVVTAQKPLN